MSKNAIEHHQERLDKMLREDKDLSGLTIKELNAILHTGKIVLTEMYNFMRRSKED